MSEGTGVVFPLIDGTRSTSATGRAIVADALRGVDPIGAAAAEREAAWRQGYPVHFRRLVEAALSDGDAARRIAADGLASVHARMRWAASDGTESELAAVPASGEPLGTETVTGAGEPERELSLPYRGARLTGDALRARVDDWVMRGVVEPGVAEAIGAVLDHPEWLCLPGRTAVVLGAGAEMGPLRALLRWGASVAALDLPRPDLWRSLLPDVRSSAGTMRVPVRSQDGPLERRAGGDLLHDLPAVTDWVADLPGDLVLGNYVYADGATNVRVCSAVDALTARLLSARPGQIAPAFLATPTDAFAVPPEAVDASVRAYRDRGSITRVAALPLRALSGGRLLRRAHVPAGGPGMSDSIVPQQGPNYLLAKRIQRWRAIDARAAGHLVSFKVAPPTRTRSVVKNRALAAAYAGAHRFGVEVFDPATSNTLMAALLVHDLYGGRGPRPHPWEDEADAACHGGLWRGPYDPRSALGIAAVLGMVTPH